MGRNSANNGGEGGNPFSRSSRRLLVPPPSSPLLPLSLYGESERIPVPAEDDLPDPGMDHSDPGSAEPAGPPLCADAHPPTRTLSIELTAEFDSVAPTDAAPHLAALVTLRAAAEAPQPPRPEDQARRRPGLDLVAAVDCSGSMYGEKLALLHRTLLFVARQLGPGDRLAVVAFRSVPSAPKGPSSSPHTL